MDAQLINCVLTGADSQGCARAVLAKVSATAGLPDELVIDRNKRDVDRVDSLFSANDATAVWYRAGDAFDDDNSWLRKVSNRVGAQFEAPVTLEALASFLADLPFELASFGPLHEIWSDEWEYRGTGFGDAHTTHGFACAFRGPGHHRLVSRRWLEFGPWRASQFSGDLTIVQFHDPHVGARAALEQARPGHQRMGISDTGGFIQMRYVYAHDLKGLYEPKQRRHKFVVHGREVTQSEMLDAAALRHYRRDDPDKPIDSIAYVFAVPEEAHAHLHEMWLREIEVWTFDPATGKEIRLDEDYEPSPPDPPEWVERLEANQAKPSSH